MTDEISSKLRFEVADRTDEISNIPTVSEADVV
ncbi:chlorohydrolase [Streptococcus pneumoniae]|nr:chlorohydrolase [Streptococcus pneumoniae]